MSRIKFRPTERDPFTDFRINMEIICNLEEGGKITEDDAFERIKKLYKKFKSFYKNEMAATDEDKS
jgi:hypothetical protein|tara:strand:+ start:1057 stop:1254 length:198 start_codon:yes stop_codon:yes gene_type:complete